MKEYIFREYDIRGKVGTELVVEEVYNLGCAIAVFFIEKNPALKTVAIGMDGRLHSPIIKEELCRAFRDSGINVQFVGLCPTPVLYFVLHTELVDAGIMITASHNGPDYNGIKLCLGKDSVWGPEIKEIQKIYQSRARILSTVLGNYSENSSAVDNYTDWLVDHFAHLQGMALSAVVDCGNGAAGVVLPNLVAKMEWEARPVLLYPEVDGTYPNHEADPVIEKNMQQVKQVLATTTLQVGIGLDGDADRMAPMTKSGKLILGDQLLALFSEPVVKQNPGRTVVFDSKCSQIVPALLTTWGAHASMSPSGHSIIKSELKKHNALLAGELSCHFFFNDRYFGYDDGIYAMLRLFELLLLSGKSLDAHIINLPRTYSTAEIRIPCEEGEKWSIIENIQKNFMVRSDSEISTLDGIRVQTPYGWGLVRASNTQPVICLRVESDTQEGLARIKSDFTTALLPYFEHKFLKTYLEQ